MKTNNTKDQATHKQSGTIPAFFQKSSAPLSDRTEKGIAAPFFTPSTIQPKRTTATNLIQRSMESPYSISEAEFVDQPIQAKLETDAPAISKMSLKKGNRSQVPNIQKVDWSSAVDSGHDARPWRTLSYTGDVYKVKTDAGRTINAWRPHDGSTYWCHGLTFGGASASGGPFSIWGQDVPKILADDAWQPVYSCLASEDGDILVFKKDNYTHSGIISSVSAPNSTIDERRSKLDSKWGPSPRNNYSWARNAGQYGKYKVYSKNATQGPCRGFGPNEDNS